MKIVLIVVAIVAALCLANFVRLFIKGYRENDFFGDDW